MLFRFYFSVTGIIFAFENWASASFIVAHKKITLPAIAASGIGQATRPIVSVLKNESALRIVNKRSKKNCN